MKAEKKSKDNKKKYLIIGVICTSILIVAGIGYFFYLVYHKDQPSFVPGETRGDIREGIKEIIAEPLANVWPSVGDAMVGAAYVAPTVQDPTDPTANWQTYKNEELGIEFKYPEGWKADIYNQNIFGNQVEMYITVDPKNTNYELSQIAIRKYNSELFEVENAELSDVETEKTETLYVGSIMGKYYTLKVPSFDSSESRNAYEWIGQIGDSVYVIAYVPNTGSTDLYEEYQGILKGFKTN